MENQLQKGLIFDIAATIVSCVLFLIAYYFLTV